MVSGETHFVRGRRYRLAVIESDEAAKVVPRTTRRLELFVRREDGRESRQRVLDRWYRELLRQQIAELLAKWEPRIGVQVRKWGIRKMRTRWGTCNREAGRIWVNLELAKKPPSSLEFIVVHELVHLVERRHNDRFRELMDEALPAWRQYREVLNRAPLSHQSWRY
jgi:predicted metal-dependent hydrolase